MINEKADEDTTGSSTPCKIDLVDVLILLPFLHVSFAFSFSTKTIMIGVKLFISITTSDDEPVRLSSDTNLRQRTRSN